ncbi:hypothetical protein BMF94_6103 [Rhodotorula taiwanensis]|uniref:FAD/NAD(P)-binding domain-containing protein n=1 Tax=Rhodotorula taiwanensis TaxID=741276 RepID=A0A2S5B2D5_9BASI|nr:hypothetical protein BMF94_6103 [Rhodotorula taiwanensis]
MFAPAPISTKNVLVLGCSYAGARAAKLLSDTLPASHRVVVIDRQSHFNHLYLQPRVSVVPGHAPKVFVPYQNVLGTPSTSPASTLSHAKRHVFVSAAVTALHDGYVELDRDLLDHERDIEGDEDEVERLTAELEQAQLDAEGKQAKQHAARRLKWDYMIYALGCTLPPPLASVARTKKDGVSFLEAQQQAINKAESILIVGGGALGIQYATDIADLYNNPANAHHLGEHSEGGPRPRKKRITLVHSRDRFMPLYKPEVHEEVMRRLAELGVEVVLGERPDLGDVADDRPGEQRVLRLKDGREFQYDLLMRCTGQKPNSQLMRDFLPGALDKSGYVNVRNTLQVDVSRCGADLSERVTRNLFAIGDVANAGVIKAGHTGWNQAGPVVQNIMCLIETDAANATRPPSMPLETARLVEYERSPPQIKLTLGLGHSVSELLPSMDAKETLVKTASDGPIDGHWKAIWENMGADPTDVHA